MASARLDPLYSPWRLWETLIIHGQKGQVEQKKGLYGHKPDREGVLGLREDKGGEKKWPENFYRLFWKFSKKLHRRVG